MEGSDRLAPCVRITPVCPNSRPIAGRERKVLTAQLKELQQDGVIRRRAANTVPPQVSYELTDAGTELVTVTDAMCTWGINHLGYS